MPTKKSKKSPEVLHYINSATRIERWLLCQQIGVVYYEAQVSLEKLKQIKDYIERRGVTD